MKWRYSCYKNMLMLYNCFLAVKTFIFIYIFLLKALIVGTNKCIQSKFLKKKIGKNCTALCILVLLLKSEI